MYFVIKLVFCLFAVNAVSFAFLYGRSDEDSKTDSNSKDDLDVSKNDFDENESNGYSPFDDPDLSDIPLPIKRAVTYIFSQQEVWDKEISRMAILLPLIDERLVKDFTLMIKQKLNIDIITHLIRDYHEVSNQKLARYIMALKATCQDPLNFYGRNLVNDLQFRIGHRNKTSTLPVIVQALCVSEVKNYNQLENYFYRELQIKASAQSILRFYDMEAYASIVAACLQKEVFKTSKPSFFEEILANTTRSYVGSVTNGDAYTEALIIQALNAWPDVQEGLSDIALNLRDSLKAKQKEDGSFGSFLATYYAIPALSSKSFFDLTKMDCSQSKKIGLIQAVSDIEGKQEITVRLSIFIEKNSVIEENFSAFKVPRSWTLMDALVLSASKNPIFKFKFDETPNGKIIYELANISNDGEKRKYWQVFKHQVGASIDYRSLTFQRRIDYGLDKIGLNDHDSFIFFYKSIDY